MIQNIRIQNYRIHTDFEVNFNQFPIIITGPNGSGKTSILEAIYLGLVGKSWRSNFAEILQRDKLSQDLADWWRVDLNFINESSRIIKFQNSQKSFILNGKAYARLPIKFREPVILFEPSNLQLLYGSPSRRRDFFDHFITQLDPTHQTNVNKLSRILKQRNNLLKRGTNSDELFIWDLQFSEVSEKIALSRKKWSAEIANRMTENYQKIAKTNDEISLKYIGKEFSHQQVLEKLRQDFRENWPLTKTGAQTHDFIIKLNQKIAKTSASRGENRTIIFAILAAMTEILDQQLKRKIYLLFDDIDSELDGSRKSKLFGLPIFRENYLIATTISSTIKNQIRLK